MRVALTTQDFLDRGGLVFADRAGIIDEPDGAQPSLGTLTYGQVARRAAAWAAGLDALGVPAGERVAVVSQNSGRLLEAFYGVTGWGRVIVPVNFRLRPDEARYIVEHSGARVLLIDPELADTLGDLQAEHRMLLGEQSDTELLRFDTEPQPWPEPRPLSEARY
jgi:acyl-CoA synthetase (AMP-forming)/AMP-acid ligase II